MYRYRCMVLLGLSVVIIFWCCSCSYMRRNKLPSDKEILVRKLTFTGRYEEFKSSGYYLITSRPDHHAYLWDWRNLDKPPLIVMRRGFYTAPLSCMDDKWLVEQAGKGIIQVDIHSERIVEWRYVGDKRNLLNIGNSKNGKYVALLLCPSDIDLPRQIAVISSRSGEMLKTITAKWWSGDDAAIAVSDDGRYVVYYKYAYDMQNKRTIKLQIPIYFHANYFVSIDSKRHLAYLAGAGDRSVCVCDIISGECVRIIPIGVDPKNNLQLPTSGMDVSPDGRWLVVSTLEPDIIHLWDLQTYKKVGEWKGTSQDICFSPDSKYFANMTFKSGEILIHKIPDALLSSRFSDKIDKDKK